MTVIGLTGYARSGKDTVGELLGSYGFERVSFADPLRAGLYALNPRLEYIESESWALLSPWPRRGRSFEYRLQELVDDVGWDAAKQDPEVRRLLQAYGTEAGRDVHGSDCWTDIAVRKVKELYRCVITDVRFPNEAEVVRELGGQVWRIDRPGVGPVNDHASDNLLGQIKVDATILNHGTLHDLAKLVDIAVGGLL